jgi:DNA-binding response OmpR family regulator
MTEDTQRGTILVVDDNLDIRGFAKRFSGIAGYTVITAADGEEGLVSTRSIKPALCCCSQTW